MRTTITIDDDVLEAARSLAEQNGCTLGKAVSELARKGANSDPMPLFDPNSDFPRFYVPPGTPTFGLEDVKRALEDVSPDEPPPRPGFKPPHTKTITMEEVKRALEDFP